MSKKEIKKEENKKVKVDVKQSQPKGAQPPQQKPQTPEEQFLSYINNVISTTILDYENIKSKTVENMKGLGQRLGMYMREVERLNKENTDLKKKLGGKKK